MRKSLLSLLLVGMVVGAGELAGQAQTWEPRRINKIIELWEMGEPVYYAQIDGGGYEDGLEMAQTEADYITYNLEHAPLDLTQLRDFMRGLVDGGPTKSGHRTPAVIVVSPALGWDMEAMRANQWVVQQIMAAGAHGILLPHAVDPTAVKLMIEAIRYPFAPTVAGLGQGRQGNGSQGFAANIWGIPANEYIQKADPWPLNPNGEFIFGLKIETIVGVQNAETLVRVPGIAFAEWGPGDQSYNLGHVLGLGAPAPGNHPMMQELRSRVFQATRDAGIKFLNSCGAQNVTAMIDEGVMICTGGGSQTSTVGRQHTNRQMPW
jgi:4-hydroxy-2-oxoheptanedioate aldolase